MKRLEFIILSLILILGFFTRLYKFDSPIADWHAWRQVDTSAVSRNFVKYGFDVLHPIFYDLSNVPSGVWENPKGYRFVEFPIYNVFQASLFKFIGKLTIEQWGRLVTIFSSLLSSIFLYLIVKKHLNGFVGLLTAFFFTFIPFNIYFGRVVLPDSSTVAAFLGAIYFLERWIEKEKLAIFNFHFFIALIFTSVAFLLKPFVIFFFLPILYLLYEKYGFTFLKNKKLWIFAVLSILPFVLWRIWMLQYPGGIPQSGWLLNGNNIRFKGAFFHWIFAERLSNLILGYWGLPLFIVGLLLKLPKKSYLFFLSFLISSILYVTTFATGNVMHDYYQILIMPSIAIYLALGSYFLWENKANIYRPVSIVILFASIAFMLSFGWFNIRAFYNINHPELIRDGKIIDSLTPKDAKVIVPTADGDTTALYFMDRQGWSSFEKPLPDLIKMGATHLVIFAPKSYDYDFGKSYKLVYASSEFLLFNLRQKP
ncbi:MAG: glycosyltransferase family 39 protein [Patescibacteria group bacterium]|nr:glycosyltransferase family 39 protein [Patescibacteria group bacterium]